jgi:leucyl-tRNA synthetase
MVFINHAEKYGLTRGTYLTFLKLLAPFAPHLTEELWAEAGHTSSIHTEDLPEVDTNLSEDEVATIGVQINGKMRGTITVPRDASESEVLRAAEADPTLGGRIQGSSKKIVYVPGRILNLVMEE